jgi:flavin-binding protein dodecin
VLLKKRLANRKQIIKGVVMNHINEGAIKVIEIIGISSKSFDDAIHQALTKASKSIKGISGFEVIKQMASLEDGKIIQYKVNLKLAFPVM